MLRVLGRGVQSCDGVTRREALRVGGLALLGGLSLPQLAAAGALGRGRARSVILINLLGGPSHLDMFDPKPEAPSDIRGPFRAIGTSVDGIQVSEHLPLTARTLHRSSLVRTVTHGYNSHNPLAVLTGFAGGNAAEFDSKPTDPPSIGAVCQYLGRGKPGVPTHAVLPCYPGWGEQIRRPGPYGGFLGPQYDPLFAVCSPTYDRPRKRDYYDAVTPLGVPRADGFDALPSITVDRLDRRRGLLEQVDAGIAAVGASPRLAQLSRTQQQAFDLLTRGAVRDAFDLEREPAARRDRYGRNMWGQSMLSARRLVEAGVVFVTVSWEVFFKNGIAFDTHENNFDALERVHLPILDRGYTALIEDLESRGLLEETLVVVMGEMGRSPRINKNAGRDHWPQCGFALLTGGGVRRGIAHGRSDATGGYPEEDPVTPGDLAATLYALLGIDPTLTVPDGEQRPVPIAHGGRPIGGIL